MKNNTNEGIKIPSFVRSLVRSFVRFILLIIINNQFRQIKHVQTTAPYIAISAIYYS